MDRRGRDGAENTLHDDLVVFDGLLISRWGPEIFSQMRSGGLTAANCTCSVWENCQETLRNIGRWNRWFREHADRIVKARGVADIRQSKSDGRTAIVLGFQNVSAFEDQVSHVEIFKDAGVGIAQLAYNTQNLVGSGCYESTDSGLSDFGHDIVSEMNRVGMMCDLSHAGVATAHETILASKKPVCFSHCLPSALKSHPRNRTDEELRLVADHGGLVGVTMFSPFLAKGLESSLDDIIDAIAYVLNLVGEDAVGIGTDFTEGYGKEFFDWITHDKGYGRALTEFGEIGGPEGFRTIADYGNLTRTMQRRGWSEVRIRKVMGENWLRVLGEVWGG